MGEVVLKTPDSFGWELVRRVFYTGLVVWAIVVRMMKVDPFDDLLAGTITLGTLFDGIVVWAMWILVWHLWSLRPRIQNSPS